MIPAAIFLLLAALPRVDLIDEVVAIPPVEWRYVEVNLKQQPVTVDCEYDVESHGGQVRVRLLTRPQLAALRRGGSSSSLADTFYGSFGSLRIPVRQPGEYVIVIENRSPGPHPARARLRVSLDFSQVGMLAPRRQLIVILVSFGVFFGIVFWSGRKLLRAIRPL